MSFKIKIKANMRRVWFVFKLFEAIFGLCCLGYHTRGFLNIDFLPSHYTYCAVFGGSTLLAMFGGLGICMKETIYPLWEGSTNLLAAISLFGVSLNSMFHAEKDFYLTYLATDVGEDIDEPYPFFKHSKAQSITALCCGCLFLLHSVLAFDVVLEEAHNTFPSDDCESHDNMEGTISDYQLHLYVCGKDVHEWLEKYEWFHSLSDANIQTIP